LKRESFEEINTLKAENARMKQKVKNKGNTPTQLGTKRTSWLKLSNSPENVRN